MAKSTTQWKCMKGVPAPADLTALRYPLLSSEKLDGWRNLVVPIGWARDNIPCAPKHQEYFDAAQHTIAISASNKPISNWHVQRQLDRPELAGCDGELIASDKFNETSSAFASFGGEPSFAFHIFDRFDRPEDSFERRLWEIQNMTLPSMIDSVELHKHPHVLVESAEYLKEYLEEQLPVDAEGAITRDPLGLYKFGRATEKQQWLLKIKPFVDDEAVVVGTEELLHNLNDPEVSQLGLTKRSSHKDGKVPSGKLGALVCKMVGSDTLFKMGTGFDDTTRRLLWAQRDELFGKIVKYKSMKHGALDAPRHPVFLGFRAEDYS